MIQRRSIAVVVVLISGVFTALILSCSTPPPVITNFSASKNEIQSGNSADIFWNTTGATAVSIDHGIGVVPVSGICKVTPTSDTIYTLTANNSGISTTKTVNIKVVAIPPEQVPVSPSSEQAQLSYIDSKGRYSIDYPKGWVIDTTTSERGYVRFGDPYSPLIVSIWVFLQTTLNDDIQETRNHIRTTQATLREDGPARMGNWDWFISYEDTNGVIYERYFKQKGDWVYELLAVQPKGPGNLPFLRCGECSDMAKTFRLLD